MVTFSRSMPFIRTCARLLAFFFYLRERFPDPIGLITFMHFFFKLGYSRSQERLLFVPLLQRTPPLPVAHRLDHGLQRPPLPLVEGLARDSQ